MRAAASRALALAGGLALLAMGRAWIGRGLAEEPAFAYGFMWFLKLAPGEVAYLWRYAAVAVPALLLLGYALGPAAARWLDRGRGLADRARWTPGLLAATSAGLTLATATLLLRNEVVTDDEWVYLFQSRLLLAGHAALPAPPGGEFLGNVFVAVSGGRWFGQYPPGHPLMLAPGVLAGWPRLVPVLLAAANALLTYVVLRRIFGRGGAAAGTALLVTSPLYLLTGATLLSHSTAYFGLALGAWGALAVRDRDGIGLGAAAGAGLGLLLLARPYTGVTLGAFPGVCFLVAALRRRRPRALGAALAVAIAAGAFFLACNRAVSGSAFVTGYQAARGPGMIEFGFGTVIPGVHDHTPAKGLVNAALLAMRFQFWAWAWPLALLPVFAAPWMWRARGGWSATPPATRIAAVAVGAGFLSYIPYWSIGVNDTGPVKTYEVLLPATVVLVAALQATTRHWGGRAVAGGIAASFAVSLVLFWPFEARHLRETTAAIAAPWKEVERVVRPPAVVFVDARREAPARSWVYGRPNPNPDLSDPILYVADLGAANPRFWERHRERRPYRMGFRGGGTVVEPLSRETP